MNLPHYKYSAHRTVTIWYFHSYENHVFMSDNWGYYIYIADKRLSSDVCYEGRPIRPLHVDKCFCRLLLIVFSEMSLPKRLSVCLCVPAVLCWCVSMCPSLSPWFLYWVNWSVSWHLTVVSSCLPLCSIRAQLLLKLITVSLNSQLMSASVIYSLPCLTILFSSNLLLI